MSTFEYGSAGTNLSGHLLNVYSKDAIRTVQNLTSEIFAMIKASPNVITGGNGTFFGVRTTGNEGMGFRLDNEALPTAGIDHVLQAQVQARPFFAVMEVTGLAAELANGQPNSFADLVADQMDDQLARAVSYREGALFRNQYGKLGEVSAINGTVVTLTADPGSLWLRDGFSVNFLDAGGTSISAAITISNVDWAANTLTVSSATGIVAGDGIYLAGTQDGATLVAKEFDGLAISLADSGTYLGIDRSTNPLWKSNVIDAAASPIDEDLMARAEVRVKQAVGADRVGSGKIKIFCHYNQLRKFMEVVYPRQQFNSPNVTLGVSSLHWGNYELIESPYCPETKVYLIDTTEWKQFKTRNGDLQIDHKANVGGFRFVPGYDKVTAYLRAYDNVVITNPRRCAVINNVANVSSR